MRTVARVVIICGDDLVKLVGAIDDPVDENWAEVNQGIFTEIHFPRNKRPNKLSNGERVILYAVGTKVLLATQTVASTLPASRDAKGSLDPRVPMAVADRCRDPPLLLAAQRRSEAA